MEWRQASTGHGGVVRQLCWKEGQNGMWVVGCAGGSTLLLLGQAATAHLSSGFQGKMELLATSSPSQGFWGRMSCWPPAHRLRDLHRLHGGSFLPEAWSCWLAGRLFGAEHRPKLEQPTLTSPCHTRLSQAPRASCLNAALRSLLQVREEEDLCSIPGPSGCTRLVPGLPGGHP